MIFFVSWNGIRAIFKKEPEDLSFKLTRQEKSFRPRSQQLKPETIPEPEKQTKIHYFVKIKPFNKNTRIINIKDLRIYRGNYKKFCV